MLHAKQELLGGLAAGLLSRASAQVLIVGNDEKQGWDENAKPIFREPGKDTLTVIDISKPDTPQIASSIPLMNSVVGPPTNLAVTPAGDINALKTWAHWDGAKLHLHFKKGMNWGRDILSMNDGKMVVLRDVESGGGSTTFSVTYSKAQ